MYAVKTYAAVRQFAFIEGKSRREAARVFGLSRDTIYKMCRFSAPPGYQRTKKPEKPKLGPLVPAIDAILQADQTAPPKQRGFKDLTRRNGLTACASFGNVLFRKMIPDTFHCKSLSRIIRHL